MTFEGVPWMVEGADHSAEVGRLLAYLAAGGGEGVVAPGDCRVVSSAIPDGKVVVLAGGVAMLNRFPGGGQQSYLARNEGSVEVVLAPQGSGGVRYDLVCVVVEDPQYPGEPAPVDLLNGPYVRMHVYQNVPVTTVSISQVDPNQTGYALARVKFDASDGTVNMVDITDLRELVSPRREEFLAVVNGIGAQQTPLPAPGVGLGSTVAAPANAVSQVKIPKWATHMIVECDWAGIQALDTGAGNGGATGFVRVWLPNMGIGTEYVEWSVDSVGAARLQTVTAFCGATLQIVEAFRGTTQELRPVLYTDTATAMAMSTDRYTAVRTRVTFMERVI